MIFEEIGSPVCECSGTERLALLGDVGHRRPAHLPGDCQGHGADAALPLGFGTILVNIPLSGAIDQVGANGQVTEGALTTLFNAGIANELFPLILFIGIGAMIDFGPVLSNPKLMIFGAAAQFGIFLTFCAASMFFGTNDAASIAVHRCGGWPDLHLRFSDAGFQVSRCHYGGGIFLHGTGAYHPAAGH